jgi:RNA polymerase sigma factor (sigma-70 family)
MSARGRSPRGDQGRDAAASPLPGSSWDDAATDAARGGDLRSWEHLIRRHQEVVFRTASLTTRDPGLAGWSTEVTFVRAFRALRTLEPEASIRPWLMGVATAVARSHVREAGLARDSRQADPHVYPMLPAASVHLDPTIPRPTPTEMTALHEAFDRLADQDRVVLASRYAFGLTRSDAASRLGIADDEVEGRLVAAITRLRTRVTGSPGVARDDRASRVTPEMPSDRLAALGDDQLGRLTMAVVTSALPWTPDVAVAVCTRLAREAAAYPEHVGAQGWTAEIAADPSARSSSPRSNLGLRSDVRRWTVASARRP